MSRDFYFHSGAAGHTSSDGTAPGYILQTFRQDTRTGTSSIAIVTGQLSTQSVAFPAIPLSFISQPILGTFTLSGSVTCSMWGLEDNLNRNASFGFRLWHKSGSLQGTGSETAMMGTIVSGAVAGDEWGTTPTRKFFTASLTNTIFRTGDRFVLRLYATGFGAAGTFGATSATGVTLYYGQTASGSAGDSILQFGQDIPIKKKIKAFR